MSDLICDICGETLKRESSTAYSCVNHKTRYLIQENLYHAANGQYEYFNKYWGKAKNISIPKQKIDKASNFVNSLPINLNVKDNIRLLDLGSGFGIHVEVFSQKVPKAKIWGVDIALDALIASAKNLPKVKFIQANAQNLPFKSNIFDIAISYGVLAYLDEPAKGIKELTRVLKRGGYIGLWFYSSPNKWSERAFKMTRICLKNLSPRFKDILYHFLVPFLGFLPTASGVSLRNSSWRVCWETIRINLDPPVLHLWDRETFTDIIEKCGLEIIHNDKNELLFWARKT
jgi:ubiquinone/menaquinone biosynthesis C-methylase UbiE